MQILRAIEVISKHQECRNAECNLNCENCQNSVTFEEVDEALEEAKKALKFTLDCKKV